MNFPAESIHGSGTRLHLDRSRLLITNRDFLKALFPNPGLLSRLATTLMSSMGLSTRRFSSFQQPASTLLDLLEPSLHRIGLTIEEYESGDSDTPAPREVNNTAWQVWIRSEQGNSIDERQLGALTDLFHSDAEWTDTLYAPVYRFPNTSSTRGLLSPLSHLLIVKGRPNTKLEVLRTLGKYQLVEAPISRYFPRDYYCVVLRDPTQQTVYDLPKRVLEAEKPLIEDVRYEYIPAIIPTASGFAPGDSLYSTQWNLAKINAQAGWNVTTPATLGSGIVVAVIDVGCDLAHPDFLSPTNAYFSSGITVTGGTTINSYTYSGTGTYTTFNPGNPHGTACAGIIAARYNSTDIAGLAGECQILPIQLANYEASSLLWAINYAASQGARVINISLDIPTPGFYDVPELKTAIDTANAVICFAAGNDNRQGLWQPAAHPKVIACGASNQEDERVKPSGEIDWGSNYGDAINPSSDPLSAGFLSVMAPGIDIPTLRLHSSTPDYIPNWGGTSAATPHVAALAALILCKNPLLTSQDVRNIIEVTAAKVPDPSKYTTLRLNGPWSSQMGYGRIDVGKALAHRLISSPMDIDKVRAEFAAELTVH